MKLPRRSLLVALPAGVACCVILAVIITPDAPASPPTLSSSAPQRYIQPPTSAIQRTPLPRLLKLLSSVNQEERASALKLLNAAQTGDAPLLHQHLHRRTKIASVDYKNILRGIGALVPNRTGRFPPKAPRRKFDWLDALLRVKPGSISQPLRPALAESLLNVALMRALATSKHYDASLSLLRFAYRHNGAFKDECGRQIRSLGAHAIPGLIRATNLDDPLAFKMVRYAAYQLDRMNFARPDTALKQTDLALRAEILHAYGEVRHLAAPNAIIRFTDAESKKVQSSARWAMLRYLSGRPPKAVKRKLTLIGGRQTDKARSLYFTYREMAKHAVIRRLARELTGQRSGPAFDESTKNLARESEPRDLAERLFALFDRRRAEQQSQGFEKTLELAQQERIDLGIARLDKLLAANPLHPQREAMAPLYLKFGRQLLAQGKLGRARSILSKAAYLSAKPDILKEARASRLVAEALSSETDLLESRWKLKRAQQIMPQLPSARAAEKQIQQRGRHRLYLAGGAGGGAAFLLLLALAFLRKRVNWK